MEELRLLAEERKVSALKTQLEALETQYAQSQSVAIATARPPDAADTLQTLETQYKADLERLKSARRVLETQKAAAQTPV